MTKATITFDPYRLREALAEEMSEHHRHGASGVCQCGMSTTKDPTEVRAHMAEVMLAVILRFQGDGPPPKKTPNEHEAERVMSWHMEDLRDQHHNLLLQYREPDHIEIPRSFPESCDGGTLFGLPVRYGDVAKPMVVAKNEPEHWQAKMHREGW